MKLIVSLFVFLISCSNVFGQKNLSDSTKTHFFLKFTSFPFLFDNRTPEGSFAVGPSASVFFEHLEIQVGILYDFAKYEERFGTPIYTSSYEQYSKLYFPFLINYNFHLSNKINCFPSIGLIPYISIMMSSTSFSHKMVVHRSRGFI
jgi:hypothetical protein